MQTSKTLRLEKQAFMRLFECFYCSIKELSDTFCLFLTVSYKKRKDLKTLVTQHNFLTPVTSLASSTVVERFLHHS